MFSKKALMINVITKSYCISRTNYGCQTKHSTFHEWTLDYFRNQPHYNKFVLKQSTIKVDQVINDPILLKTLSTDELLAKFLSTNYKVKPIHYRIDCELEKRVNNMSINHVLVLMDAYLSRKHHIINKSKSFKKCLEIMNEMWFRRPDLTSSQTLQLMYYASIYKSVSKPVVELGLQKLINDIKYLKQLNDVELSILAVSTYKSGAKVYDKILRIFVHRLENNINDLLQNPSHFVSLIKPLKKAKYHDRILLKQLVTVLNNNNNNQVLTNMTCSIHLLTYLADANCGNVEFLQTLIDSIGDLMIKNKLEHIRIKDISSYLFSASYLGLPPKDDNVCKIIMSFLDQILANKENSKKMSTELTGICLSMWMLDFKPIKLMTFLLSELSVNAIKNNNAHKQNNRHNLLTACAAIEHPNLIKKCQLVKETTSSMPNVHRHLGERPFLEKVFKTLKEISYKLDVSDVKYNFNVPHLKILGIKVVKNNGKTTYVEVLDNSNCLYDTEIPNGMMKLKSRLASKLNFTVISVNYKDTSLHDPMLLRCHLESVLS